MNSTQPAPSAYNLGDLVTVVPERVAHGGSTVARHDGKVIFVRHSAVGETVQVRITGIGRKNRFYFADTVAVESASADRREHPWSSADALKTPMPVGGMEFAHLQPSLQREYKKSVVIEQLQRLGHLSAEHSVLQEFTVDALGSEEFGQRTRVHYGVSENGRIAMYPHQSDQPVEVKDFPLAEQSLNDLRLEELDLLGVNRVDAAISSTGQRFIQFCGVTGAEPSELESRVGQQLPKLWGDLEEQKIAVRFIASRISGRRRGARPADICWGNPVLTEQVKWDENVSTLEVDGSGFWQNHQQAPQKLTSLLREFAEFELGDTVLDLYAGAGLLTAAAADAVGDSGYVLAVEGSPVTSANAAHNFELGGKGRTKNAQKTEIDVVRSDVSRALAKIESGSKKHRAASPDVVIIDPSREGAGKNVVQQISNLKPKKIIYVACDPAALGRDTGYFRELGWDIDKAQGLDMYPNTHHVETIARFRLLD